MKRIIIITFVASLLSGCTAPVDIIPKQGIGTLNTLIGGDGGTPVDKADEVFIDQAVQRAGTAATGRTIRWGNPNSGNWGIITPTAPPRRTKAGYCRFYDLTNLIDGRTEWATGRACRQPDGSWRIDA